MVVLAVDVPSAIRRRSPDGLPGSTRTDRPLGSAAQLVQADTRVDVDLRVRGVGPGVDPVRGGRVDSQTAAVLGVAAVGTTGLRGRAIHRDGVRRRPPGCLIDDGRWQRSARDPGVVRGTSATLQGGVVPSRSAGGELIVADIVTRVPARAVQRSPPRVAGVPAGRKIRPLNDD